MIRYKLQLQRARVVTVRRKFNCEYSISLIFATAFNSVTLRTSDESMERATSSTSSAAHELMKWWQWKHPTIAQEWEAKWNRLCKFDFILANFSLLSFSTRCWMLLSKWYLKFRIWIFARSQIYLSFHLKIIVSTSHLLLCSLLLMFFWCCCCAAMGRRISVEGIRAAAKVFLEIYSRRDTFNVTYRKVSWSEARRVDTCASDALNSMSMRVCAVQMKNERIRSWLSKVGCFFQLPRLISQNIKLHSIWTRIYSFFPTAISRCSVCNDAITMTMWMLCWCSLYVRCVENLMTLKMTTVWLWHNSDEGRSSRSSNEYNLN